MTSRDRGEHAMKRIRAAATMGGLLLLLHGAARAEYRIEPILKIGDRVGDITLTKDQSFTLGPLNDRGQLLFDVGVFAFAPNKPDRLFQCADGKLTTILAPGTDGPIGMWPKDVLVNIPLSMNQRGQV